MGWTCGIYFCCETFWGGFSGLHPLGLGKGGASWRWPKSQKSERNVSKNSKGILAQDFGLDLGLDPDLGLDLGLGLGLGLGYIVTRRLGRRSDLDLD